MGPNKCTFTFQQTRTSRWNIFCILSRKCVLYNWNGKVFGLLREPVVNMYEKLLCVPQPIVCNSQSEWGIGWNEKGNSLSAAYFLKSAGAPCLTPNIFFILAIENAISHLIKPNVDTETLSADFLVFADAFWSLWQLQIFWRALWWFQQQQPTFILSIPRPSQAFDKLESS